MRLIGPNCPGLMTPGEAKIGFIPNHVGRPGRVGVVARSGTLTYEVIQGLSDAGHGETTAVGIGGDPVLGSTFVDILPLFAADPATERGGAGRRDRRVGRGAGGGVDPRQSGFDKPVVAFISGRTAPPGKRMGHAGAIISGTTGSAQGKIDALRGRGRRGRRHHRGRGAAGRGAADRSLAPVPGVPSWSRARASGSALSQDRSVVPRARGSGRPAVARAAWPGTWPSRRGAGCRRVAPGR